MLFRGDYNQESFSVTYDDVPLELYLEHVNHSPCGFAWGYEGSGPSQLAFAMLYETTSNLQLSLGLYQQFKREYVARLPREESWQIPTWEIMSWIKDKLYDKQAANRHLKTKLHGRIK